MSYPPNNVISVETETYLCCSIINTLFCFFWLGIPAIICSCQAKDRYDFGDFNGGRSSASTAKILNIIGFVLGGLCWLIGIIILILVFTGIGIFSSTIFG
jgi:hypothetical protein